MDALVFDSIRDIGKECDEYMALWHTVNELEGWSDEPIREQEDAFNAWSRYSAKKVADICRENLK